MLLTPDCILCIQKASLAAIRELTSDEAVVREIMTDILSIPALQGRDWTLTSPEVFEMGFRKITEAFGNPDPFRTWKDRQNQKGLGLYPQLKSVIRDSPDPLATAIKLAIIGNSLDLMWSEGSVEVEPLIRDKLSNPLSAEHLTAFKEWISRSRLILLIGDNCGEIAFDKLLIETIRERCAAEVIFAVRTVPILNDATLQDAQTVGLSEVARVIDNGIEGPVPGTVIRRCSEEFRAAVDEADFIVSKGGGNFDSLNEEKQIAHKLCYMLMSKCAPYKNHFNTPLYEPILFVPSPMSASYSGAH